MKAAGYVRASTAEGQRLGVARADQRRSIERFVTEQEWSLIRIYEDIGAEAKAGERPALKKLLGELGAVDKVVVASLDRLGRTGQRLSNVLDQLAGAEVDLVSLKEGFDTGAPSGRVVPVLLATVAEWEPNQEWRGQGGWQVDSLRSFDFSPRTVIDVGAADGTPALYDSFPQARHVLIEPLREFEEDLARLTRAHDAYFLATAVGSTTGKTKIFVDQDDPLMSSVLKTVVPRQRLSEREVPITTLDALMQEGGWEGPFGLKIDAEGFEREVVEGATALLEETEFVIAELSLSERFEGSSSSRDFIALLDHRGFTVLDVLDAARVRIGLHADVLFGRKSA
jgi:FkbM family methyltransferase